MKILWITNTLLGPLGERLLGKRSNGVWMDALLHLFSQASDHQIVVATTHSVSHTIRLVEDNVEYYALPDATPLLYNENLRSNREAWCELLQTVHPDIIQVWGTEFSHGLCALREAKDIPAVIYMQGVLKAISRYYLAGIPEKEIRKFTTFRDLVKRDSILDQLKHYGSNSAKEAEMLRLAGNAICENDWCEEHLKAIVPSIKVHRCPLSINPIFGQFKWDIATMERHSIMCTASGYPLKGLHMMLRALASLKTRYPDVKLYIPGTKMVSDGSIQWLLRKRGYTLYIERLITELAIENNIIWMGHLPQQKLAETLARVNAFVLCSALENHSSSLKEAMMVGTPCVASAVGGVTEYVHHGQNALLYRFEEHEMLAHHLSKIFDDDLLATNLSVNSVGSMKHLHDENDIYNSIVGIYDAILGL